MFENLSIYKGFGAAYVTNKKSQMQRNIGMHTEFKKEEIVIVHQGSLSNNQNAILIGIKTLLKHLDMEKLPGSKQWSIGISVDLERKGISNVMGNKYMLARVVLKIDGAIVQTVKYSSGRHIILLKEHCLIEPRFKKCSNGRPL